MPGNIRDPYQRATFQGPDPVSTLRDQVSQLSQQVAHLSGMLQQQSARPNPAPPATGNQELLLQLLLEQLVLHNPVMLFLYHADLFLIVRLVVL